MWMIRRFYNLVFQDIPAIFLPVEAIIVHIIETGPPVF